MDKMMEIFKNDRFAGNCGIKIVEFSNGYAKCTMEVTENHLNGLDILMGGALFTLADFCFSVAANSYGNVAVALHASISFLKKCTGGIVTAVATEISRNKRIGVYRVCLTNEMNEQIGEFSGTVYIKS